MFSFSGSRLLRFWLLAFVAASGILAASSLAGETLEKAFESPPDAARPWVYWFWMNGNITKEGITADLEAMKRVGIGGTLIMSVSTGILPGKVDFMTPEWRELFAFAVAEADRLGLEIIMNNDDGWTGSGGPWNTVENSMQVLTSSEVQVKGPSRFDAVLPLPPAKLDYYRDIAILALPDSQDNPDPKKAPGIENWQAKAGYVHGKRIDPVVSDDNAAGIPSAKIVDLTSKVDAEGRLQWDVPEGNWVLLRLGHTTNGRRNHPCTPHGVGLECDKLSKEAMEKHFDGFLAKLIADVGPLVGKSLVGTHVDSWEVGSQNWTPKLREEFKSRRGYDPSPYYPALVGHVVENLEVSERFLWDYRKTLADMMADNYFGHLRELAKKHGMIMSAEAYGGDFDHLQAASRMDIPMSEFWVRSPEPNSPSNWVTMMDPTSKWASSAAHVAGRKIVAAEAFTATDHEGKWQNHPYKIKALGDLMFAEGVNRFVFHRYAMQPWMDRLPGMTFGAWGTCIERTLTWFEPGRAWFRYLARCQHLLQEGDFVADICFFHGESAPNHAYDRAELESRLPTGYDYDGCNDEAIMRMTVEDGCLALPSGMRYRVLVLPESRFVTPELLAKIRELVRDGAHVVGPRPEKSPSLANYPACDDEVRRLAGELWGDVSAPGEKAVGKGRVYWGVPLDVVLGSLGVLPDVEVTGESWAAIPWLHRRIDGADVYFVSNQEDHPKRIDAKFRVGGKQPELWHADTGQIEPAGVWQPTNDGRTTVRFRLEPRGSVFVVFREPAADASSIAAVSRDGEVLIGPIQPPEVVVDRAVYGVPGDPARTIDVTRHVADRVARGARSIRVWSTLGGDPAYGVVKTLRVDYRVDGEQRTATANDGTEVRLMTSVAAELPEAEVKTLDGRPFLVASRSGNYALTDASGKNVAVNVSGVPDPITVAGPWELRFPPGWDAPESILLDELIAWPEHKHDGVKYFSGTAVYRKKLEIPADRLGPGKELVLDLGKVAVMAEVRLNGKDLGILWKPPFCVAITDVAKAGTNDLEVRVTNLWPNRLIGDERKPPYLKWKPDGGPAEWPDWLAEGGAVPETGRLTFTTWRHFTKDSPLLESGLLGPVTLRSAEVVALP